MQSLFPQIEPLLFGVEQAGPLRGRRGRRAQPVHGPGRDRPGCSPTRTPTRSGCRTRGSRSSTRSSTSALTPWPSGPMRRGSTWRRRCGPRGPAVQRGEPRGRRATSTSSPSTSRPSSPTRTCSTCSTWPDPAADRRARRDRPGGARRRALHVQPRAAGRLPRRGRPRRRRGGRRRAHRRHRRLARGPWRAIARRLHRRAGRDRGGLRARASTSRATTVPAWSPRCSTRRRPPRSSTSARSPTSRSGPTRSTSSSRLTEVVHDRLNVEVFRGCTRGCRFCQAGMITRPVRERPADQVIADGARRPRAHRLRRGRADVAVDGRLLGDRGRRSRDIVDDPSPRGRSR